jgi:hypothetical protein
VLVRARRRRKDAVPSARSAARRRRLDPPHHPLPGWNTSSMVYGTPSISARIISAGAPGFASRGRENDVSERERGDDGREGEEEDGVCRGPGGPAIRRRDRFVEDQSLGEGGRNSKERSVLR